MNSLLRSQGLRMILAAAITLAYPLTGEAFGGKSEEDPPPAQAPAPQYQQAKPYRLVELSRVFAPVFPLPNGQNVNITSELNSLIDSTINTSRYIRTVEGNSKNRLVISGGITALEMDIVQVGIHFGWNHNGIIPISGAPNLTGDVDFHLDVLEMDFKIYDRVTGQTYVASYTNQEMSNLHIQVHANLAELGAAIDVIQKTGIAEAVRTATKDIMQKLEDNSQFVYLPWEAEVLGVDRDQGKISFNSGGANGVRVNDVYSVYSACPLETPENGDGCFSRFLADVKVNSVGSPFAEATGFSASDSVQGIRAGDRVYVKPLVQVNQ